MPAQQGWIHELAKSEIHPDVEQLLQLNGSFDPQQLVEESTIQFLSELRQCFNDFIHAFNGYAEGGARFQEVKVYNLAQTAADFMVFRNQIKLVISNSAHGSIQLSFTTHVRGTLAVNGQSLSQESAVGSKPAELLAQVGPFRDVYWTYQGEKISAEQVGKFYFTEFVRLTRDNRRSKAGNQLLIEQIKTLLEEKGLHL
jgi:hypothetical protein